MITNTIVIALASSGCQEESEPSHKLSMDFWFSCSLSTVGAADCWGENDNGASPVVPATLPPLKQVTTGLELMCGVDINGGLQCRGNEQRAFSIDSNDAGLIQPVTYVEASWAHICYIEQDGQLNCIDNYSSQSNIIPTEHEPVQAVAAGFEHICAIETDNELICWSSNEYNQTLIPAGIDNVKQISAGYHHTCAVDYDNQLTCWGSNEYGQLAINSELDITQVTQVASNLIHTCALDAPIDLGPQVSAGTSGTRSCAIDAVGAVTCWGQAN